ncbi:MAG: hypothetical protein SGILL_007049, partial [Bacillariaceae sp.]
ITMVTLSFAVDSADGSDEEKVTHDRRTLGRDRRSSTTLSFVLDDSSDDEEEMTHDQRTPIRDRKSTTTVSFVVDVSDEEEAEVIHDRRTTIFKSSEKVQADIVPTTSISKAKATNRSSLAFPVSSPPIAKKNTATPGDSPPKVPLRRLSSPKVLDFKHDGAAEEETARLNEAAPPETAAALEQPGRSTSKAAPNVVKFSARVCHNTQGKHQVQSPFAGLGDEAVNSRATDYVTRSGLKTTGLDLVPEPSDKVVIDDERRFTLKERYDALARGMSSALQKMKRDGLLATPLPSNRLPCAPTLIFAVGDDVQRDGKPPNPKQVPNYQVAWLPKMEAHLRHDLVYASTSKFQARSHCGARWRMSVLSFLDGNELINMTKALGGSEIEEFLVERRKGSGGTKKLRSIKNGDLQYSSVVLHLSFFSFSKRWKLGFGQEPKALFTKLENNGINIVLLGSGLSCTGAGTFIHDDAPIDAFRAHSEWWIVRAARKTKRWDSLSPIGNLIIGSVFGVTEQDSYKGAIVQSSNYNHPIENGDREKVLGTVSFIGSENFERQGDIMFRLSFPKEYRDANAEGQTVTNDEVE